MTGGTWAESASLTVGGTGTGTLNVAGGVLTVGGTLSTGTTGSLTISSGSLQVGTTTLRSNTFSGATSIASGVVTIGAGGMSGSVTGDFTNTRLIFNRSDASTYSGILSGTGTVVKQGGGGLVFAGSNSYSGVTTISGGTLALSGSGSIGTGGLNLGTTGSPGVFDLAALVSGTYFLPATGDLTGAGTLSGDGKTLAVLGSFLPGNSPGTVTVSSGLSLNLTNSGSSVFEITNPAYTAGTYDLVNGDGSVVFGGVLNLVFTSGTYANGADVLQLFANTGGRSGNFSSVTFTGLGVGQSATFNPVTGSVSIVPEPSTYAMALAGLACGGFSMWRRRKRSRSGGAAPWAPALAAVLLCSTNAHAVTIDWVTVGDPGNANDTINSGTNPNYGAVAASFQIMKYEFTNQQYTDFLNSVAATDTYSLYNASMGSNARGGITQSGASGSYTYAVKTNMGDKPVNFVSWFDVARVSNWLMNGATGTSSTETGAYTLNGATSGTAPTMNPGATYSIPTENQWYKAAYYKGGSTNAGYWTYATQSNSAPTAVTAGATGIGSAGSAGNFANYNYAASWNSQGGNVTTVGTNGGPSAYGAFDMSGNVSEWNDGTAANGWTPGRRGGPFGGTLSSLSSAVSFTGDQAGSNETRGFRLVSPVAVPEPSTCVMALAGLACGGFSMWRRRKRP